MTRHAPLLRPGNRIPGKPAWDRIELEMLACPAFCDALMQVQAREQLAIFVVADGAEKPLQQMMPENRQRWFSAPDTPAETLVEAAMLRL